MVGTSFQRYVAFEWYVRNSCSLDFTEQLLSAVRHFARRLRDDGHSEASSEILRILSEKVRVPLPC